MNKDVFFDALADYEAGEVVVAQGDGSEFRLEPPEAKRYAHAILQAAVSIECAQWQAMEEVLNEFTGPVELEE